MIVTTAVGSANEARVGWRHLRQPVLTDGALLPANGLLGIILAWPRRGAREDRVLLQLRRIAEDLHMQEKETDGGIVLVFHDKTARDQYAQRRQVCIFTLLRLLGRLLVAVLLYFLQTFRPGDDTLAPAQLVRAEVLSRFQVAGWIPKQLAVRFAPAIPEAS